MKQKKLIALLLASAMACVSLAGCGDSKSDSKADEQQTTAAGSEAAKDESKAETSQEEGKSESGDKQFEGVTLTLLNRSSATPKGVLKSILNPVKKIMW